MPAATFDPSFFTDPITGNFRFPAYTTNWKGLVQIRDNTPYKKECFAGLAETQIQAFNLGDFEAAKFKPEFDIDTLEFFIESFPEKCFDKGVSRRGLDYLLAIFSGYGGSSREVIEDDYVALENYEAEGAVAIGLIARVDPARIKKAKDLWALSSNKEIENFCLDFNISPVSSRAKTIQKLIDHGIISPGLPFEPTPLLREVYQSFLRMYLDDIKYATRHFHPKLLKPLWEEVMDVNSYEGIDEEVKEILRHPYWIPGSEHYVAGFPPPVYSSNAAFTFCWPPKDSSFPVKAIDPNDVDHRETYRKGREGTYDPRYFQKNGTFSYPDYTSDYKGVVYIEDKTNFNKKYLTGLSPAEIRDFSIDDFERTFVPPDWEIRDYYDFLEDLTSNHLPDGIKGKDLRDKLYTCDDYFRTNGKSNDGSGYEVLAANDPFIQHGFFVKAEFPFSNMGRAWDTMSEEALREICIANNIRPAKKKIAIIWDLVNANVPLPITFYRPTEKLQGFFQNLAQVYINDIREHTAHFHPLFFESLWDKVADLTDDHEVAVMAYSILGEAAWEDKLVTVINPKPTPKKVSKERKSYRGTAKPAQAEKPVEKPAGLKLAGLTRESVMEAVQQIDLSRLTKSQLNSSYRVTIEEKVYPFKLLVETAYKIANGFALPADTFKEYFYLVKQFENFTGFKVKIDADILFRNAIKGDCFIIHHPAYLLDMKDNSRLDLSALGTSVNDPEEKKKRFRSEPGIAELEPGTVLFLTTGSEVYGLVKVMEDENMPAPNLPVHSFMALHPGPAHGLDFSDRNYPVIAVHFYDDEFKSLCKTLDRNVPELVQNAVAELKGIKPETVAV